MRCVEFGINQLFLISYTIAIGVAHSINAIAGIGADIHGVVGPEAKKTRSLNAGDIFANLKARWRIERFKANCLRNQLQRFT